MKRAVVALVLTVAALMCVPEPANAGPGASHATLSRGAAHSPVAVPDVAWQRLENGPDRAQHAMVYDPVNQLYWSFGGVEADVEGANVHNSVYRLDATDDSAPWELVPVSGLRPPEMVFHSAVYHPVRTQMIVYGGQVDGADVADGNTLWTLDLSEPDDPAWTRESVPGNGTRRAAHAATYVPQFDAMVVSGGFDDSDDFRTDSYALLLGETPMRWVRLANRGFNSRAGHAMVYDATSGSLLAYGGVTNSGNDATRDLVRLDISGGLTDPDEWQRITTATPGRERAVFASGFDAERRLWWVQGGLDGNRFLSDLSVLDLNALPPEWTVTGVQANGPTTRLFAASTWNPDRNRLVVQGGSPDNNRTVSDTRALDYTTGSTATPTASTASPTLTPSATATPTGSPTATTDATTPPSATATASDTPPTTGTPFPTPVSSATQTATASATATATSPTASRALYLPLVVNQDEVLAPTATTQRPVETPPPDPTATETPPVGSPTATVSPTATPTQAIEGQILGHVGGRAGALAIDGTTAYVGIGPRLHALDISDPASPQEVAKSPPVRDEGRAILIRDGLLYFGHDEGIAVFDLSDIGLVPIAEIRSGSVRDLAATDDRLYSATSVGLEIYDLVDPRSPSRVTRANLGSLDAIEIPDPQDPIAFIGGQRRLRVMDLTDASDVTEITALDLDSTPQDIVLDDTTMYVGTYGAVYVMDIADPTAPTVLGSSTEVSSAQSLDAADNLLYVSTFFPGLTVFDVSDPTSPTAIGNLERPAGTFRDTVVSGAFVFMAADEHGLQVADVSEPTNPTLAGGLDVALSAGALLVEGGVAYVGGEGLHWVDISDPTDLAFTPAVTDTRQSLEFARIGDHVVSADGFSGHTVYEITAPGAVSRTSQDGNAYDPFGVAAVGSTAYLSDRSFGLRILDVSDPALPNEIGALAVDGTFWGVAVDPDAGIAALGDRDDAVHVVDVSDPTAPLLLSTLPTDGSVYDVRFDGDHLYVGYGDTLLIVDVTDPTSPSAVATVEMTVAFNPYVIEQVGSRLYVGGFNGVSVVDVSDPQTPTELGFQRLPGYVSDLHVDGSSVATVGSSGLILLRLEER